MFSGPEMLIEREKFTHKFIAKVVTSITDLQFLYNGGTDQHATPAAFSQ